MAARNELTSQLLKQLRIRLGTAPITAANSAIKHDPHVARASPAQSSLQAPQQTSMGSKTAPTGNASQSVVNKLQAAPEFFSESGTSHVSATERSRLEKVNEAALYMNKAQKVAPSQSSSVTTQAVTHEEPAPVSAHPDLPDSSFISAALAELEHERSGALYWELYCELRRAEVPLSNAQIAAFANGALHVEWDTRRWRAVYRVLLMLRDVRKEWEERGDAADGRVLAAASKAFALLGMHAEVRGLMEEARADTDSELATEMGASLIMAHGVARDFAPALALYTVLLPTSPPPLQPSLLVAMLNACALNDELDRGVELLQEAHARGITLESRMFSPLFRASVADGKVDVAQALVQMAREHGLDIHDGAIRTFSNGGPPFVSLARQILGDARQRDAPLRVSSLSKMAAAILQGEGKEAAEEVLLPADDFETAFSALHKMIRDDAQAANAANSKTQRRLRAPQIEHTERYRVDVSDLPPQPWRDPEWRKQRAIRRALQRRLNGQ